MILVWLTTEARFELYVDWFGLVDNGSPIRAIQFFTGGWLVWFGLVWFGLVWFGLVWFGLVWFGLVWLITEARLGLQFFADGWYFRFRRDG